MNNSEPFALQTASLAYSYSTKNSQSTPLHFPDIGLRCGESCAVVGPSGNGKTTLLHLIAGLLSPSAGYVEVAGQRLQELSRQQRDRHRGQHIGMVLQQLRLVESLTALENLLLAQRFSGQPIDKNAAKNQLAALGLEHRLHHRPNALSQGEAQRVAIARALVSKPQLLLADEPTSSLDDDNAETVLQLLCEHSRINGAALLVVTHDARVRGRLDKLLSLAKSSPEPKP